MSIEKEQRKNNYKGTIEKGDSFIQRLQDEDMQYYKKDGKIYWENLREEDIYKEDLKEDLEDEMDDYSR